MKQKMTLLNSLLIFLALTVLCGIIYTGIVTLISQVLFNKQANGSIITVNGKKYGSILLGQQFSDDTHLWGRIMNVDVSTFTDKDGNMLMYSAPSNLSPASEEYGELVAERVARLKASNPDMGDEPIPVDLVTSSGSGLDPHISPAAAAYQVKRIASARNIPESEVEQVIDACTSGRFLGLFGEETVNVLKANLMLDGILK